MKADAGRRQRMRVALAGVIAGLDPDGSLPLSPRVLLLIRGLVAWSPRDPALGLRPGDVTALARSVKVGTIDLEAAIEQIADGRQRDRQGVSDARWRMLLPIEARVSEPECQTAVEIEGVAFRLSTIEQALSAEERDAVHAALQRAVGPRWNGVTGACWITESTGSDAHKAWRGIAHAHDVFRGVIELAGWRGRWDFGSSWKPRSVSRLPHPEYCIALSADGRIDHLAWHLLGQTPYSDAMLIGPGLMDELRRMTALIREVPERGASARWLAEGLRLYAFALDEPLEGRQLLALWQMAEALTSYGDGDCNTRTVSSRLARMARTLDVAGCNPLEDVLRVIGDKRNQIVHRGDTDSVHAEDVGLLKLACEHALEWLASSIGSLRSTSDLVAWQELAGAPDAHCESRRIAASFILESRRG
jgi:hypothetical protein